MGRPPRPDPRRPPLVHRRSRRRQRTRRLAAADRAPVRHTYKLPSQSDVLPDPAALLVAPTTLNTTTKWAAGHADTLALGLITEALGIPERPVVALPYINAAQAQHPALAPAIATLRSAGVHYLLDDGNGPGFRPHQPKQGNVDAYPWDLALDTLDTLRCS